MANESIHSNAQNFPSFASGGVDPRTGLYTFSLSLPAITSGDLAGPEFSLALTFNPIGGNDWALGTGWSTNLSHVRMREPRMLKLSTGEQFKVEGSGAEPAITERKLPSFRYLQHDESSAQIIYRTGAVEHLRYPGVGDYLLPCMLQGPTGHGLHLTYESDEGRPRLATISDDHDTLLLQLVKVGANLIQVITATGQFALNFDSGRLRSLDLPDDIGGSWAFEYTGDGVPYANITQVTQPMGAVERLTYDEYHLVPASGMPNVPRVTRHEVDGGPDTAMIVNEYRYGDDNHNFLGFGGLSDWQDDGTDNLYRASPGYTYSVAQVQKNGDQARTTTRVYNGFHLQTSETTQEADCIVERTTRYHLIEGAPFEAQPSQFQLPKTVTTQWRVQGQALVRSETTTTEFDVHGNLTYQRLPNGQETLFTYYPAAGETDDKGVACPPDPWGFARHYRTITQRPARKQGDPWFDDMTVTTYRHGRVECVGATPGKPVPAGAAVQAVDILTQSTRGGSTAYQQEAIEYYHCPDDEGRHQHGRVQSRRTLLWQEQSPEHCATTTDRHLYEKVLPGAKHAAGRLRTTVHSTATDGCEHSAVREQCLATGLPLASRDTEGTEVTYEYDVLQRLLSARVQDSTAPAERTFAYHRRGVSGLPEAEQTSATGVTTRTVYDRLGREKARYRTDGWQTEHTHSDMGLFWQGRYDAFGRLVEETEYDDCGNGAAVVPLTSTYQYDNWGRVKATLLPDGTRQVNETSPFGKAGPITASWLEGTPGEDGERPRQGVTRTEMGEFGKPVLSEVTLSDGSIEQRITYTYDGWGQCTEQSEQFRQGTGLGTAQRTRMSYDPWGRLWSTTQPNNDVFTQAFAAHSREAWVTQISYAQYGALDPSPKPLAKRCFDGSGRVTKQTQGGRTLSYQYAGASPSPSQAHQADGEVITYTYKPSLTSGPLTAQGGGLNFRYDYDTTTAQLLQAEPTDPQGQPLVRGSAAITNVYRYAKTGELLEDTRTDQGQRYTTLYRQSFAGRRVERSDCGAGNSVYGYDDAGRLCKQQVIAEDGTATETATLTYNAFGQLHQRQCGELITESTYDTLGRETERRTLRSGKLLRRYTHVYHGNGNLAERCTFNDTDQQVLRETFDYDMRNRLIQQVNEGLPADLPRDSTGQPFINQIFEFDALDNLATVLSIYPSGDTRLTQAYFAENDPCQLSRLVHTQVARNSASKSVEEETFVYDANGRLESRSSGWQLSYDAFGRLASLRQPGGSARNYRYDPQGTLCAVNDGADDQQRFYDGLSVNHLRHGTRVQRYLTAAGTPLAMLETGEAKATPLITDRNGSVTGEWREDALHAAVYDAYGNSQGATPLACELGFNGELREGPGSDLYLLGRGYRLYDAALMRFLAPDDASPFDEGGLNPYAYCRGNPVMFHDPTGYMPQWTAANMPYYVPPPEMQQEAGGGWMDGLLKMAGWAFIGYEAFSLIKLGVLVATATAGAVTMGAAAAGLAAVALGLGVASMLDEDNEALMYASIGVGVFSGLAGGKAVKALKAGRTVGAGQAIGAGRAGPAVGASDDGLDALINWKRPYKMVAKSGEQPAPIQPPARIEFYNTRFRQRFKLPPAHAPKPSGAIEQPAGLPMHLNSASDASPASNSALSQQATNGVDGFKAQGAPPSILRSGKRTTIDNVRGTEVLKRKTVTFADEE